ncbi:MAG: hypothetical protein PHN72_06940 [Bacilli bacterium]|nr:hypothetical protein [Bacilli bacterium]
MTQDDLKNIKREMEAIKESKEKGENLEKRLMELENNSIVQEYLRIKTTLQNDKSLYWAKKISDDRILENAINYVRITNTDHIYICMGTYRESTQIDIEHGSSDIRVERDDPSASYREYRNIELPLHDMDCTQQISISECAQFEQDNIVLYPYRESNANGQYYYKMRNMYFEDALTIGKEKALEKVLAIRNQQKNNLK